MSVDILVCNFNTKHLIQEMKDAVDASVDKPSTRFLIVDNASTDGSAQYIREKHPEMQLICNQVNVGFGRANNQLLPWVESDYVLLLNTDAFVSPDCLRKTVDFMDTHPECGVLGVRLRSRDGSLQPSCRYFPTPLNIFLMRSGLHRWLPWVRLVDDMNWPHDQVQECDWVPGCYYLVRRAVVDQVGLFDPRFFLYYEEVDHCKRVKQAGWKVYFYPHADTIHIGGESAKSAGSIENAGRQLSSLQIESELLYIRKHHGLTGLMVHLALTLAYEVLSAAKRLVNGRSRQSSIRAQMQPIWRICQATVWGTTPTR